MNNEHQKKIDAHRKKIMDWIFSYLFSIAPSQEEAERIRSLLPPAQDPALDSPSAEESPSAQDPDRLEVIQMMSTRPWQPHDAIRAIGMISKTCPNIIVVTYCPGSVVFLQQNPWPDYTIPRITLGGLN